MWSQQNHTTLRGKPFTALLLVVLACALLLPFLGNAEGEGGDLPNPIPPLNGENQIIIDTIFITPGGEDSTLFYIE